MTDRSEAKVRAFVVELLDQPVEPPSFAAIAVRTHEPTPTVASRRGSAIALAAFAAALLVGAAVLLPLWAGDAPPATADAVVARMTTDINDGDVEATLGWFAQDAQCVAPGLPTCEELIGFFVAADAEIVFTDCGVLIEPYLQCNGFVHTSIHDVLGISRNDLQLMPNFPPAFIVENGQIIQMNFSSPFTGDFNLDDQMWTYFMEIGVDFLDENGSPRLSAGIVDNFKDAARSFVNRN